VINSIGNGEAGLSVREKLNQAIAQLNAAPTTLDLAEKLDTSAFNWAGIPDKPSTFPPNTPEIAVSYTGSLGGNITVSSPSQSKVISVSGDLINPVSAAIRYNDSERATTGLVFSNLEVLLSGSFISANGLTSLAFPELLVANADILAANSSSLISLSMPKLRELSPINGGQFPPSSNLLSLDFPELVYVATLFAVPSLATNVNLPKLKAITGNFIIGGAMNALSLPELVSTQSFQNNGLFTGTVLDFPKLKTVTAFTNATSANMPNITTMNFPSLETVSGVAMVSLNLPNLTTFNIGMLKTYSNANFGFNFTGCKLNQASIDGILASFANLDGTNGKSLWGTGKTLTLSGGTNATPSSAGLASKAIIVARGAAVLNN